MKAKIVDRLVALRVKLNNNKYVLEQDRLLGVLSNMWGQCTPAQTMHHNDRVRVYSIVMAIENNRSLFKRLAESVPLWKIPV